MFPQQLQPPSYNQLPSSRSSNNPQVQQSENKSVQQQQLTKHSLSSSSSSSTAPPPGVPTHPDYYSQNNTPKKERVAPSSGYSRSSEKKKRYPDADLTQSLFDPPTPMMMNKPPAPNTNNNNTIQATKRPYNNTEQIKQQDESSDYRQSKKTKLDLSPILDDKPFMTNNDLPNELFDPDCFFNSDFLSTTTTPSLTAPAPAALDNNSMKPVSKGFSTNGGTDRVSWMIFHRELHFIL
jgi:hypothetical protein